MQPGFHIIPEAEYHARPELSKSRLDTFHKSPAHYRFALNTGWSESSKAMEFGSCLHMLLLEEERFNAEVLECGLTRNTKAYKEFKEANKGKIIIKPDEYRKLFYMRDALHHNHEAKVLLDKAEREVSAIWQHRSGVMCRSRFDLMFKGILGDLKSTTCAEPRLFQKSMAKYRYHVQAAFYCDAYQSITGEQARGFFLIVCEKSAPYQCFVFQVDDSAIDQGRREYEADIERLLKCEETQYWPGYAEGVERLTLPDLYDSTA